MQPLGVKEKLKRGLHLNSIVHNEFVRLQETFCSLLIISVLVFVLNVIFSSFLSLFSYQTSVLYTSCAALASCSRVD